MIIVDDQIIVDQDIKITRTLVGGQIIDLD